MVWRVSPSLMYSPAGFCVRGGLRPRFPLILCHAAWNLRFSFHPDPGMVERMKSPNSNLQPSILWIGPPKKEEKDFFFLKQKKRKRKKKVPTHEAKVAIHGSLFASPASAVGGPDRVLQTPGTAGLYPRSSLFSFFVGLNFDFFILFPYFPIFPFFLWIRKTETKTCVGSTSVKT